MNIGQAARASGVSAKMIRYYESSGLIPAARRTYSGYRDYGPHDVQTLRFVRRARDLGFSVERIRDLLALWSDRSKGNAEVRKVALAHIADMQSQATRLQEMIATLSHLVQSCRKENRDDCPIIRDLGTGSADRTPLAKASRPKLRHQ
jgi:Cu(I)-responsive transcriptional regulator